MIRPKQTLSSLKREVEESLMHAQANLSWAVVYMNSPEGQAYQAKCQEKMRETQRRLRRLK